MNASYYDFFDGTNIPGLSYKYLAGACRSDWNSRYEQAISEFSGVPYAISFGSGRMGFYALLESYGIGPGDEVIIPAFTCVVVPNAILYRGAKPIYVDIDSRTFNIDVAKIEGAITPQTKALLAQHTFGQPCDIEALQQLAHRRGLILIEDCSHAFGGTYQGKLLGTFGDAAFTSTDHSKVLSTSVGGFALCKSATVAQSLKAIQARSSRPPWHVRLRLLCQYDLLTRLTRPSVHRMMHPVIQTLNRLRLFFYFRDELQTRRPSYYPARLTNFQAFVGWHEIARLAANIRHRREIAQHYHDAFRQQKADIGEGAYLRYSLLVKTPALWIEHLSDLFVVGRWFTSIAQGRLDHWERVAYQPGSCPVGEYVANHIINFPTHFLINREAVQALQRHLQENRALQNDILATSRRFDEMDPQGGPVVSMNSMSGGL